MNLMPAKSGRELTRTTTLREVIARSPACSCDKCSHGCTMGSGALAEEDHSRIAKHLMIKEEDLKERYLEPIEKFNTTLYRPKIMREKGKPYGRCLFLTDDRKCGIHPVKPRECRVAMGCSPEAEKLISWFTLNHYVNPEDPESIRQYASHLKDCNKALPGSQLNDLVPDKEKLRKMLDYELLTQEQDDKVKDTERMITKTKDVHKRKKR